VIIDDFNNARKVLKAAIDTHVRGVVWFADPLVLETLDEKHDEHIEEDWIRQKVYDLGFSESQLDESVQLLKKWGYIDLQNRLTNRAYNTTQMLMEIGAAVVLVLVMVITMLFSKACG